MRFDHRKSSLVPPLQQEHIYLFAFEPPQGKISEQNEVILLPAAGIAVVLGEQSDVQSGVGRPPELRTQEGRTRKPQQRCKASAPRGDRPTARRGPRVGAGPAKTFCCQRGRNNSERQAATDIEW